MNDDDHQSSLSKGRGCGSTQAGSTWSAAPRLAPWHRAAGEAISSSYQPLLLILGIEPSPLRVNEAICRLLPRRRSLLHGEELYAGDKSYKSSSYRSSACAAWASSRNSCVLSILPDVKGVRQRPEAVLALRVDVGFALVDHHGGRASGCRSRTDCSRSRPPACYRRRGCSLSSCYPEWSPRKALPRRPPVS